MSLIIVFLFVAIGVIFLTLQKFKWFILTILFIFIYYLILKIWKERKTFKKVYETSFGELCLVLLNQINGYKHVLIKNNHMIFICEYGLFVIYAINYEGMITGKLEDSTLKLKHHNYEQIIPNVFHNFNELIKQYENITLQKVEGYLIISNNCEVSVSLPFYNSKYRLFVNDFKLHYKNKILNKEKIDYIYHSLKG